MSMKVGEIITFQRESTPSTGYRWYVSYLKNFALLGEELEYDLAEGGKYGASATQLFTLQAIQAGTAEVQFVRYRASEPDKQLYDQILPFEVEPADAEAVDTLLTVTPGGWSTFKTPDDTALVAFKEFAESHKGVDYKPLLAASQVVNSKNYIFIANATIVYPGARPYGVLIRVYKAPDKAAKVIEIKQIGRPTGSGAYGDFDDLSDASNTALTEAFKHFVGSTFTALKVTVQTVAGRNYRFAGNLTLKTKEPVTYPALVTVYKPLEGEARITEIRKAYEL
jgi:predicted secreted protein